MKRNQKIACFSIVVLVGIAVAAVTASSLPNTPLYTVRMEQASYKMGFLPTAVNEFAYTTAHGYTVQYDAGKATIIPLEPPTEVPTCPYTCDDDTCQQTCPDTCWSTCSSSCGGTCPATCEPTCEQQTCGDSCHTEPSCKIVCDP